MSVCVCKGCGVSVKWVVVCLCVCVQGHRVSVQGRECWVCVSHVDHKVKRLH